MRKEDIVSAIMKASGIEVKRQARQAVDAVFAGITKSLSRGEEVSISGFGTFKTAKSAARMGINPKTKQKIQIPASIKPKFKAAKALKDSVK